MVLNRGRSSRPRIARLCRALSALFLASGTCFVARWVPNEYNPADAPSLGISTDQIVNLRTSQVVNVSPYQNLYLCSHIGDYDSYGPNGESTVIASVVCGNTVPGDLITHHHNGLLASPIQLPPLLGIMHSSLRSYDGKVIETEGHDIAFTLVVETRE